MRRRPLPPEVRDLVVNEPGALVPRDGENVPLTEEELAQVRALLERRPVFVVKKSGVALDLDPLPARADARPVKFKDGTYRGRCMHTGKHLGRVHIRGDRLWWDRPLEKAESGRLEKASDLHPGEHWITVHPHGDEENGHPVLVKDNPDGSASIIGGAGGKLSGMRLTGLKSPEELKTRAKARQKEKRAKREAEEKQLATTLGDEGYKEAKSKQAEHLYQLGEKQEQTKDEFIDHIAKQQGWQNYQIPEEELTDLTDRERERTLNAHKRRLLTAARAVERGTREIALVHHEEAAQLATGDVPFGEIVPPKNEGGGKGYAAEFAEAAAAAGLAAGLTPEQQKALGPKQQKDQSWRGIIDRSKDMEDAHRRKAAIDEMQALAAAARERDKEIAEDLRAKGLPAGDLSHLDLTPKAEKLTDLVSTLTAGAKLKAATKELKQAQQQLSGAPTELRLARAASVITGVPSEEQLAKAVEDALSGERRERALREFVEFANELEAVEPLSQHLSVGQAAVLSEVTTAFGIEAVDPVMLDLLGPKVAGQLVAASMRANLSPEEMVAAKTRLATRHIETQVEIAREAEREARGKWAQANEITLPDVETVGDLVSAQQQNAHRAQLIAEARQLAGVARGRLEAAAALNYSLLEGGDRESEFVPLGQMSAKDALTHVMALGLTDPSVYTQYPDPASKIHDGEFTIHYDSHNRILELEPKGYDKLALQSRPAARHLAAEIRAIHGGEFDEPGWLPTGFSRRPKTNFDVDGLPVVPVDTSFKIPAYRETPRTRLAGERVMGAEEREKARRQRGGARIPVLRAGASAEDLAESLRAHIGRRVNAGQTAAQIRADLYSEGFRVKLGLSGSEAYEQALRDTFPLSPPEIPHVPFDRPAAAAGMDAAVERHATDLLAAGWSVPATRNAILADPGAVGIDDAEGKASFTAAAEKVVPRLAEIAAEAAPKESRYVRRQKQLRDYHADMNARMRRYAEGAGGKLVQPLDVNDPAVHDTLYQVVATNPGLRHAFAPQGNLTRAGRKQVRAWAYENLFGIDPKDEKAAIKLPPNEARGADAWQGLQADGGDPYAKIADLWAAKGGGGGEPTLFEEASPLKAAPVYGTVDLADDAAVLAAARAHPRELGIAAEVRVNHETAQRETFAPDLEESEERPHSLCVARARNAIRRARRDWFFGQHSGIRDLDGFNPDGVQTGHQRWTDFVRAVGGERRAYRTLQELMQDDLVGRFAAGYHERSGRSLTVAEQALSHVEGFRKAMLPEDARRRLARHGQAEVAGVRTRTAGGQFAEEEEELRAKTERERERAREGHALTSEQEGAVEPIRAVRKTIGPAGEAALASLIPGMNLANVRTGFEPKQALNWSDDEAGLKRQRITKAVLRAKRLAVASGTGSGKTPIGIGSFLEARHRGEVHRGIYAVPSIVQGQFGAEIAAFMDPQHPVNFHAQPGEGAAGRRAAYADPDTHMVVVTHQALRDDLGWAVAQHRFNGNQEKADAWMRSPDHTPEERAAAVQEAVDAEGWHFQFSMNDEAHDALNRRGKPNSLLSNTIDAFTRNHRYHISASADPVKNDSSEVFSLLSKVAPDNYPPSAEAGFMRKFMRGGRTMLRALKAEMAPYVYPEKVPTGVDRQVSTERVELTPEQHEAYREVEQAAARVRLAHRRGTVDVEAMKTLSPNTFARVPEAQHEELAGKLARSIGVISHAALNRVVNTHPNGAKLTRAVEILNRPELRGQAALVFAHNLAAVAQIADELKAQGIPAIALTGGNSSEEKDRIRAHFTNPESPTRVMVSSDAGAVGANLQRASILLNWDTPYTAKTHQQRVGRVDRPGQKQDVTVIDLVANTPFEEANRRRLTRKQGMREEFTSPAELLDDTGRAQFISREDQAAFDKFVRDGTVPDEEEHAPVIAARVAAHYDPAEVALVNATCRTKGSVGANAVTPRYVQQTAKPGETILDFGAGQKAQHTVALRAQGLNVTAHDFGTNITEGLHDRGALSRRYDTVYASNVLNTQASPDMFNRTLDELASVMAPGGRVVANYPYMEKQQARLGMDNAAVEAALKERFEEVKLVGGSRGAKSGSLWELRGPKGLQKGYRQLSLFDEPAPTGTVALPPGGAPAPPPEPEAPPTAVRHTYRQLSHHEDEDEGDNTRRVRNAIQILAPSGRSHYHALAEHTQLPRAEVGRHLIRLQRSGEIVRDGPLYRLTGWGRVERPGRLHGSGLSKANQRLYAHLFHGDRCEAPRCKVRCPHSLHRVDGSMVRACTPAHAKAAHEALKRRQKRPRLAKSVVVVIRVIQKPPADAGDMGGRSLPGPTYEEVSGGPGRPVVIDDRKGRPDYRPPGDDLGKAYDPTKHPKAPHGAAGRYRGGQWVPSAAQPGLPDLPRVPEVARRARTAYETAYHKTLRECEAALLGLKVERCYVIDPAGRVIYTQTGDENQILLNQDACGGFHGCTFTHNHPGGGSFSDADMAFAMRWNLGEMRAVNERNTYSMKRPRRGWSWYIWENLVNVYRYLADMRAKRALQASITAEELQWWQGNLHHAHMVWEDLAAHFGLEYRAFPTPGSPQASTAELRQLPPIGAKWIVFTATPRGVWGLTTDGHREMLFPTMQRDEAAAWVERFTVANNVTLHPQEPGGGDQPALDLASRPPAGPFAVRALGKAAAFDPAQHPRKPGGSREGGQFARTGTAALAAQLGRLVEHGTWGHTQEYLAAQAAKPGDVRAFLTRHQLAQRTEAEEQARASLEARVGPTQAAVLARAYADLDARAGLHDDDTERLLAEDRRELVLERDQAYQRMMAATEIPAYEEARREFDLAEQRLGDTSHLAEEEEPVPTERPPRQDNVFEGSFDVRRTGGVDRICQEWFGRDLSDEEIAAMIGAPGGSHVTVKGMSFSDWSDENDRKSGWMLKIDAYHPYLSDCRREFQKTRTGALDCKNYALSTKPDAPRELGTQIFARQVATLRKLGVRAIKTSAARSDLSFTPYIGYKVWPKLGYDGPIPMSHRDEAKRRWDAEFMSDLLQNPEAWKWWEEKGCTVQLAFDLEDDGPDNYCLSRLRHYLALKGIQQEL